MKLIMKLLISRNKLSGNINTYTTLQISYVSKKNY